MSGKIVTVLLLATFTFFTLSTCKPVEISSQKSIVVTYSVLGSVVRDLVGDKAQVTVSIPNGLDPHEWDPSARDIETINKADLLIQNGLGLEGGLGKTLTVAEQSGVKFFIATDYINIRHVGPGEDIPSGDPDQAIGAPDPHFWMDPVEMKNVVTGLAPVLMRDLNLDVSEQAVNLESRLEDLNTEISSLIDTIAPENRLLVTGHESMGYFAQRYGFKLIGVIIPSLSTQAEVSAEDLAALKKAIQDNKVKVLFTELGTSPNIALTIGKETGAKVVELTTHAVPQDGSYLTFMRNISHVIIDALK